MLDTKIIEEEVRAGGVSYYHYLLEILVIHRLQRMYDWFIISFINLGPNFITVLDECVVLHGDYIPYMIQ